MSRVLMLAAAMTLLGCGPTVSDICNGLEAHCPGTGSDCEEDGDELSDLAGEEGCDDQFDAYIDCLDTASCEWRDECAVERDNIDNCVGGLPD